MKCWVVNEKIGMTVVSGRFLYGKLPFPPSDTGVSMWGHCSFPPWELRFPAWEPWFHL